MQFFRSALRLEVEKLTKQVQSLAQVVASQNQTPAFDLATFMGTAMDSQAKQMGATGDFIRMLHELALERMASVMGRRGGRKRAANAERDARGRMLPARKTQPVGDCILCDDPTSPDFSVAEFERHQGHKGARRRPSRDEPVDVTVDENKESREVRKVDYPLPFVERVQSTGEVDGSSVHNSAAQEDGIDKAHVH